MTDAKEANSASNSAGRPVTEVAVGVLVQPDGRYLLAQRPAGKPYEGYWEFPGGKLEPGETVEAALALSLLKRARDITIGVPVLWSWQLLESRRLRAKLKLDGPEAV